MPRRHSTLMRAACAAITSGLAFVWLQLVFHAPARVHVRGGVFSAAECEHAIAIAEAEAAWTKKRHAFYPTEDFEMRTVAALANVSEAVESRVLPLLRGAFGVREELNLTLNDLFLVRYSTAGQAGLTMHVDGTTLSFSVALSEPNEYASGGIEFELLGSAPIRAERGAVVMHPGHIRHRGATVTAGRRYVLVGFVDVGSGRMVTYGASPPGSPELLHGLFATCTQLVAPSGVAGELPREMTDERCMGKLTWLWNF